MVALETGIIPTFIGHPPILHPLDYGPNRFLFGHIFHSRPASIEHDIYKRKHNKVVHISFCTKLGYRALGSVPVNLKKKLLHACLDILGTMTQIPTTFWKP